MKSGSAPELESECGELNWRYTRIESVTSLICPYSQHTWDKLPIEDILGCPHLDRQKVWAFILGIGLVSSDYYLLYIT